MNIKTKKFPKHACQYCGAESKLVETLLDDKFIWNEVQKNYEPSKFMDEFEHTGNERCTLCDEKWTGE